MGSWSATHWLIVLAVVVILLIGTKRIVKVGSDLGHMLSGFRRALSNSAPSSENAGDRDRAASADSREE